MCERGISLFLPFSVYMISVCSRVALPEEDCCIVIQRPSVQKSIEYKFNKISLFIASILTWRLCCSFFLFLWLCFMLCSVVYFAVWMCKSPALSCQILSSCYSQRIEMWGKKNNKVCPPVWPHCLEWYCQCGWTGLSTYHSYFRQAAHIGHMFIDFLDYFNYDLYLFIYFKRAQLILVFAVTKSCN